MARKNFRFQGFGFPIIIKNARTKIIQDEEVLDVNYQDLQVALFVALIRKPARLTGAEVRFLRHHLEYTQAQFAKFLPIDRSLISKWEHADLKVTGMTIQAEVFLRMKLAKVVHQDLDQEFDLLEAGSAAKGTGKSLEIALGKAS